MPRRRLTPARQQYEAAFPTLTARVPSEVKDKLTTVLQAQGLNFSEWVQAQAAGAALGHEQATATGRVAGFRAGLSEGRTQGRTAYLILGAAMLWEQYGKRLGNTNEAWTDRRAVECVGALTADQRTYLLGLLERAPRLAPAVARWLRDSGLPELSSQPAPSPPSPARMAGRPSRA